MLTTGFSVGEGHAELLKQVFLLGRGLGDAAETDLAPRP